MIEHWIWLSTCLDAASSHLVPLLERYHTPEHIYKASIAELSSLYILSDTELKRFNNKALDRAYKIIDECAGSGINIIPFDSPDYPQALKTISNPPAVLYHKGTFKSFNQIPIICIVGSRKVSDYGSKSAWSLSARLSAGGVLVLSGGAVGTDTQAHEGALSVGAKTIAVLPCGINFGYLKTNDFLRKQIADNGCLISELPPDEPLHRNAFQVRNRLLSAMSLGVVVIEASEKSGTLITARHALEQGRDVFVIPGRPDDVNHEGSNMLLRDGAKPVFTADDIFSEYEDKYPNIIDVNKAKSMNLARLYRTFHSPRLFDDFTPVESQSADSSKKIKKNIVEGLPKNAEIVYNYLDIDVFTVDDLLECGLSFEDILASVTQLELFGYVKAVPGGRYAIIY